MPSPHPQFNLRVPEPLYKAVEKRAAHLGVSSNTYVLLVLAAELGFSQNGPDQVTEVLLKRHAREAAVRGKGKPAL